MTGGLDNSERKSGMQRVKALGKEPQTTHSFRDCGSLTAFSASPTLLPLTAL